MTNMMTACQAKEQTLERLNQVAKEFITNYVEGAIQEAINRGDFIAVVAFEGVINPEVSGKVVCDLLSDKGFSAEHVYYGHEKEVKDNFILISWENA
jgi:hypothetical protein